MHATTYTLLKRRFANCVVLYKQQHILPPPQWNNHKKKTIHGGEGKPRARWLDLLNTWEFFLKGLGFLTAVTVLFSLGPLVGQVWELVGNKANADSLDFGLAHPKRSISLRYPAMWLFMRNLSFRSEIFGHLYFYNWFNSTSTFWILEMEVSKANRKTQKGLLPGLPAQYVQTGEWLCELSRLCFMQYFSLT